MPARGLLVCVALVLAGCAVVSLGCGSSDPDSPPSTATPAETGTSTAVTPTATETPTPSPTAVTASPEPATATTPPTATPVKDMDDEALAADLAERVLASVREEFGEAAEALTAHAFPLGEGDEQGALWAVVSNGAQPAYVDEDGNVINFFHFVALYRRNADATWSEALDTLTLETAPQRVDVEVQDTGPRRARGSAPLIVMRGGTGAHSGTLDVVIVEGERLRTAVSHISARPGAGDIADLDGDGVFELILNSSNPYVFCYACAVEERSELVYRWDGVEYSAVTIEAPEDLEGNLAEGARRVARLAEANLWREAGALAVETSRGAPEHEGLRWLSIAVNRTATLRLAYAGSAGQPLLTNVLAGEYGAAYALMQALPPEEAFALDGPLISGTAAETDLPTMVAYLLFYADEALKVRDDDPAIHAVRALGQVLASPDELSRARSSIGRALRLAPDDLFLQQAEAYLDSIDVAPGAASDER
ncbi:MAG: hypothetical protein OXI51_04080 [Chloroflexota bacterium]|nr:hypothetical protein [Chloroflexota bacterium]